MPLRLMRPSPRRPSIWIAALLGGTVLALLLRPVLFVSSLFLVRALANLVALGVGQLPWLDPVYTQAAFRSLGDAQLQGLAVAGPVGDWLHAQSPTAQPEPHRPR